MQRRRVIAPPRSSVRQCASLVALRLDGSDAIDLDIERSVPRRNEDEAPGWRILRKITRIDGIDGFEVGRVGAVNGTFYHFVQ
jgi:hypothetical protein